MNHVQPGRSHFVSVGELVLHVRQDETPGAEGDRPPIVYLNSLGSDLRIWDGVVAELPGRHLRFDARGHGLSDAPAGSYTISQLATDLLRLLELLGGEPHVLVGISVGGQVALRAALEAPELVRGLVVCDSAPLIGSAASWNERIATVERSGLAGISGGVVSRWFSADFAERAPASFAGYRNMLERTPPAGYLGTCAALRDEDLRPHLAAITAPTLVLCGSEDEPTPPRLSQELASGLPHGRYQEIPDAAHLPCIEQPKQVALAIGGFLSQLGRRGDR